ncbi:MAG: IS3 family transposase [Candidatus Lokiarchaeota archaeon]|nr:IS3 family transposase [Candidatus Lokiarchaeota archaeon]
MAIRFNQIADNKSKKESYLHDQPNETTNWLWSVLKILKVLGIPSSNYYRWCNNSSLTDNRGRTPSLDRTLPEEEQKIVAYALKHPQEGYRRVAWMMVDEDVVYVCPSTVYRILDKHDLLYRWKRSSSVGVRPAKAREADERWHTDILYLWVMDRWFFLVTVLDAYSRYIVHWKLVFSMAADDVMDVIEEALEKTPAAAPQVVSDNGSQFIGKEFRKLIKRHSLVQIKTRRQHPESNGLIERYHRSFREEGVGERALSDYYQACDLIKKWIDYYNNRRLHSAIYYLRSVDYYRGEPKKLIKERLEKLKQARKLRR